MAHRTCTRYTERPIQAHSSFMRAFTFCLLVIYGRHLTQDPRPSAPSPKPQTPKPKPQTPNPKPQTPSTKHQAPSTKHQAPSTKPIILAHKKRSDMIAPFFVIPLSYVILTFR